MIQLIGKKVLLGFSILCIGALSSCGGEREEAAVNAPSSTEIPAAPAKANNPLAKEQALMKDAAAVQGLLNKDADAKKKALEDAMN